MTRARRSLQTRILSGLSVLAVVTLVLILLLLAVQFRNSAQLLKDRGLYDLSETIAQHLKKVGPGRYTAALPAEVTELLAPNGAHSFTVSDANGVVLVSRPGHAVTPLHPFSPHEGGRVEYFQHTGQHAGRGHENNFGATVQWRIAGEPLWIQVTQQVSGEEVFAGMVTTFLGGVGWVVVPFFLLLALVNTVIVRRAMAPLRRASERAAMIGPGSPDTRLSTVGLPSEVVPVFEAVNLALDRLDGALDAQRRFTADAAHELLTPLAVLTAHLDTIEDKKTASAVREDVDAMSDIVTQLLALSEIEAAGTPSDQVVDLRETCIEVASLAAPLAYRQGKSVAFTGVETPVMVRGCGKLIARALLNLVKNAIAHTPKGTTVEIGLGADAMLQVTDAGPGVPPAQRELIFQRFWRGKAGRGAGAGLGLAIVRSTVESFGGTVEVGDAPEGGAAFTLRFPTIRGAVADRSGLTY